MKKLRSVLVIIFIILTILGFPFLLDWFYGTGVPGRLFHNNFLAESWFSFLGSYIPAMLIGTLTIYQTFIIREKDQQYKELLDRYLFIPYRNAEVYRYSPANNRIGGWTCLEYLQLLDKENDKRESNIDKLWKNGYILEFYVQNKGNIGLKGIECKSIEWIMHSDQSFVMEKKDNIKTIWKSIGEARYLVSVFWIFDDDKKISKEIALYMNNGIRKDLNYYKSDIFLKMIITNEEKKQYGISMKFKMSCPNEAAPYKLQSIEEHFYPG